MSDSTMPIFMCCFQVCALLIGGAVTTADHGQRAEIGTNGTTEGPILDDLEPSITTIEWTHSAFLDSPENAYHLLWTPQNRDIVFRVEVRTSGYVGFGLSRNGRMAGSDIVVGWVDQNGNPFLEDRHGTTSHAEPILDKKQNYHLLSGFENETHTVLVFRRKYDTCDRHDVRITNDTVRIIYAYDDGDPEEPMTTTTAVAANVSKHRLNGHGRQKRGFKSLVLTQHVRRPSSQNRKSSSSDDADNDGSLSNDDVIRNWDLLSNEVLLPEDDDTLYWCKLFKLPVDIKHKHHVIGFEPIIEHGNEGYMHHALIYQCPSGTSGGDETELERLLSTDGHLCYEPTLPDALKSCDRLIVAWAIGSQGFFMPADMGHPLDPISEGNYVMMAIHYDNPFLQDGVKDSSGIRLFYTASLRPIEVGILSIGIDPNWKHLIPPKQTAVVSYGHCVGKCTEKTFPADGIHVFAAVLHSHSLGKKLQLRHVRGDIELPPIVVDNNYDADYQEYRMFKVPVKVLPGDHLIAECTYNTRGRDRMTQGGFTTREEMCLIFVYHHPRMDLSLCHSVPTLNTVHASLGVTEVYKDRIPAVIKSPAKFANRSIAEHMAVYDWTKNMKLYRDVIRTGSFEVQCGVKRGRTSSTESDSHHYYPDIRTSYQEPKGCVSGRHGANSRHQQDDEDGKHGGHKKKDRDDVTTPSTNIATVTSSNETISVVKPTKGAPQPSRDLPSRSAASAQWAPKIGLIVVVTCSSMLIYLRMT